MTSPDTDSVPTKVLEEALKSWGDKANEKPEFNIREITLPETVELIRSLGNR